MRFVALFSLATMASACASTRGLEPPVLPEPVVHATETASSDAALPLLRIELLARAAQLREGEEHELAAEDAGWLSALIDERGRPTTEQVGREGVEAFARLCMHGLADRELTVACVEQLDDAVLASELPPRFGDRMLARACMRLGGTEQGRSLACDAG